MKLAAMAATLGCTKQAVHSLLANADKAARARETRDRLEIHACKRGVTIGELREQLLEAIADDGLVDAILDDRAEATR